MAAADAIFAALKKQDTGATSLKSYDDVMNASFVVKDLHARRNMRLAFKSGFYMGGFKATLMTLTKGALSGGKIAVQPDAAEPRATAQAMRFSPDNKLTFRKLDAVFKSGNKTRDDIPLHLIIGKEIPPDVAEFYSHVCPAGVYERDGDKLI